MLTSASDKAKLLKNISKNSNLDDSGISLLVFPSRANLIARSLELLDKLQKRVYMTVDPSIAVSLEPLAHCQNVANISLFYRYYFGKCSSELAELVPLSYSRGKFTCYSDRLHDFSVTIVRCYKDVYVNRFFLCTARLWNSLPIECFPLTYDLSGFKSRINRHLLTVGLF